MEIINYAVERVNMSAKTQLSARNARKHNVLIMRAQLQLDAKSQCFPVGGLTAFNVGTRSRTRVAI